MRPFTVWLKIVINYLALIISTQGLKCFKYMVLFLEQWNTPPWQSSINFKLRPPWGTLVPPGGHPGQ